MANVTGKKLDGVDVTVIVDRSGSMASPTKTGRSRWEDAAEGAIALAGKAAKYDEDGITVYTFASGFKKYESVGAERVAQIFQEDEPNGSTALDRVLGDVFSSFLARKGSGSHKPNGDLVIVVTDGEPDDQQAVKKQIIEFTQNLDSDGDFGILFVQIGNDRGASAFLTALDDDLKGAKFDIVNVMTMDDVGEKSLAEVLTSAFED